MKNKKLNVIRIILAVLLIADMAVIFWSSSQTASQSSKLSIGLAEKIVEAEEAHKKPAATKPPQQSSPENPSASSEKPAETEAQVPEETVNKAAEEMKHRVEVSKKDDTVRTLAHMGEFATLGALFAFFMYSLFYGTSSVITPTLLSAALGTLYALSDEIHQIFVDGRSFEWFDVGIDFIGCIIGVGVALLLYSGIVFFLKRKDRLT